MKKMKAFVEQREMFLEKLCLRWIPSISNKKNANEKIDRTDANRTLGHNTEDESIHTEEEYNWSTEFQMPEEVLQQYIQFITAASQIATDSIPYASDVIYGQSFGQKLDIFGTDLPDVAPILVYIDGGFWKQISKEMYRFPAVCMHKAGVKTFVVGYDQRQHVTLWNIVDQVKDAIVYVLNYAEKKGSRGVYLAGHSGGAHIIAKVLANYKLFECDGIRRLNGVYFISGLYDLRKFCLTSANNVVNLTKTDAISLSPLLNCYSHLESFNIRFYVLAGEKESSTFKSQTRDFYEHLFDVCPTKNMYLEIKDNMDHFNIVKCLTNNENFVINLILCDLRKRC